jgi:hypothetical protein
MTGKPKMYDVVLMGTMMAPTGAMPMDALERMRVAVGKVGCHAVSPVWAVDQAARGACGPVLVMYEWVYREGIGASMVLQSDPDGPSVVLGGGIAVSGDELATRHLPDGETYDLVSVQIALEVPYSAGAIALFVAQAAEAYGRRKDSGDPLPAGAWTEHDPR